MATYTTEPKDIDLLQLEAELGVQGIHVCHYNGQMTVEAPCAAKKLSDTLATHVPDPQLKAQREAAQEQVAQQAEVERQTKCDAIKAKLNLSDEDLECLREALRA